MNEIQKTEDYERKLLNEFVMKNGEMVAFYQILKESIVPFFALLSPLGVFVSLNLSFLEDWRSSIIYVLTPVFLLLLAMILCVYLYKKLKRLSDKEGLSFINLHKVDFDSSKIYFSGENIREKNSNKWAEIYTILDVDFGTMEAKTNKPIDPIISFYELSEKYELVD